MWRLLKSRRVQAGLVAVAALVAVAVWPRSIDVDLVRVTRGPLVVTIDDEGETRVQHKFILTAPVGGELQRIRLEPGDRVSGGRVVARILPQAPVPLDARARAEADAAVRAGEAVVARAAAERERLASTAALADQQHDRARRLLAGGAISREELEIREAGARIAAEALHAAEFALAEARHEVEAARARVMPVAPGRPQPEIAIVAPIDGVVLKRYQESARVVAPGEPLLEIGDPQHIEVVTDLLSADAVKVVPGAEVILDQWGGSQPLTGRVRRIEPSGFTKISALGVEEQRVNVIIDIVGLDDAPMPLGDAFRTEVRIVLWKAGDVVTVPTGSLFRRGQDWAVFVVENGRARTRTVTVGHRNGAAAHVLSGVVEGEAVVLFPPETVVDGSRVRLRPGR